MTLNELIRSDYQSLLQMAKKIDPINGQDYLHDAFLKIPEDKEVNITYLYFTIKNLMIDDIRKNKEVVYDLSNFEITENEAYDYSVGISEIKSKLTDFQKLLLELIRSHKISLLQIAKETNIEYKVIYRNYQKIKTICKDLEML
jgi:DNA-directed RNA polymerase specialized sigma24 family protein